MAKKRPVAPNDDVRRFLSANGKLGGQTTKRLVQLGKEKAEEKGEDVKSEVREEIQRTQKMS